MKIAVMGAGGVGGYLGAKLAAGGADVTFIARGAHLQAMREHGLVLRGIEPLRATSARYTASPAELGVVDLVLFCVKLYDTREAARLILPVVGPDTAVLTLQNGVDNVADIGSVVGARHVLAGAAFFPASLTAPGEVTYLGKIGTKPHVAFGEPAGGSSERAEQFARAARSVGLVVEVAQDTQRLLWEKFVLIAGTSAATTLTRQTVGVVRADPHMRALLRDAVAEAVAVARAGEVTLDDDVVDQVMATLDTNPPDGKASQLVDLENGRRLELDGLSGAVVRRGEQLGVPTPVHRTVYAALKPFVAGSCR